MISYLIEVTYLATTLKLSTLETSLMFPLPLCTHAVRSLSIIRYMDTIFF